MKSILALLALSTAAMAQPAVTAVVDGAAYTPNIAQGSVFVVKGTGLSAAGTVAATAIAPAAQCVNNLKPVFWDDTEDNGHAIRRGSLSCTAF